MIFNKYLVKISNAVQQKNNKENLKNSNTTKAHHQNDSSSNSNMDLTAANNNSNNNNIAGARNLEYERAIAASYAHNNHHQHHHHQQQHHSSHAHLMIPKKKKPKINVHNTNNTKSCLTTDELAFIIKGVSNNHKTKRDTLKETGTNNTMLCKDTTSALRETKSSLTLDLSTSPSSSGVYSNASSSYASTPSSLQAPSSSRSCSSTESLNYSDSTPYSSNVSTPTSLPNSGNPAWPLSSSTLEISYELAVLRLRMWIYPLVLFLSFFLLNIHSCGGL